MPTYEYRCTDCDEPLEVVQKFADAPLTVCPSCAGRLRKVFSPVGVVFKGSGFYKTDSRSRGKRGDAKPSETAATTASVDGAGSSANGQRDGAKVGAAAGEANGSGAKSDGGAGNGSASGNGTKPSSAEGGSSGSDAKPAASASKPAGKPVNKVA